MHARFDDVAVERLRRRRTVKWTLYGPDVLAAWVAEMDFDVAPRRARRDRRRRRGVGYRFPRAADHFRCAIFFTRRNESRG